MAERDLQNTIRLYLSKLGITNWRNNVGRGWAGKLVRVKKPGPIIVSPADVIVRNARPLNSGLCTGSSDIIGITPVTITPDMVGQTIGVFTGIEVKTKSGRTSDAQTNFLQAVTDLGGYAGVARSEADALTIVRPGQRS